MVNYNAIIDPYTLMQFSFWSLQKLKHSLYHLWFWTGFNVSHVATAVVNQEKNNHSKSSSDLLIFIGCFNTLTSVMWCWDKKIDWLSC